MEMTINPNLIVPPRTRYSELSHKRNIEYFLEQLTQSELKDPVIAYLVKPWMGMGVIHGSYRVLSKEEAEALLKRDSRFQFTTLQEFLTQQEEIRIGKYKLNEDGLILGKNPVYK